jgi:hypothetical protein
LSSCSSSVTRHCVASAFLSRSLWLFARSTNSYHNTIAHQVTLQQYIIRKDIVSKLTVNATLMVTMLVRMAYISSLSSKISSWKGVSFQSISRCSNLRLVREKLGTCAPDVPGPLGAWSI